MTEKELLDKLNINRYCENCQELLHYKVLSVCAKCAFSLSIETNLRKDK